MTGHTQNLNEPLPLSTRMPEPHWYRLYVGECPVCGNPRGYRERVYYKNEPRPMEDEKRYVYLSDRETYDHCVG